MSRKPFFLDLKFDRVAFVTLSLLYIAGMVAYSLLSQESRPLPPNGLPPDPPEAVIAAEDAAYEHGFRKGYDAFLKQTGQDDKVTQSAGVAYAYTSSAFEEDDDDVQRGYVDGYHKATEAQHCPRSYYEN